jgi:hypothetical protein
MNKIDSPRIGNTMKTTQFNNLTMVDRAWLVYDFGEFLMSIEYYDYRINLYSLNGQFIEIFQNIETRQIERIQGVSYKGIDKYLSRIIVGSLKKK